MFFKKDKGINTEKYFGPTGTAYTMGLNMVSCTVVGAGMGYFLDDWLGTKPWLFIVLLFLGIIAGFLNLYRDTKKLMRQQEEEDAKRFGRKD